MSRRYVHTCLRVRDPEASLRFYGALGFEPRGRLNFESAYNLYLGLPGDGDVLELTVNHGQQEPYDLGTGYNHMAVAVDDIEAALQKAESLGGTRVMGPEKIMDMVELGQFKDPEGHVIGVVKPLDM